MASSPVLPRIPAVFVHVTDMPRAVEFYSRLLGIPPRLEDVQHGIYLIALESGVDLLLDANHADQRPTTPDFHLHATCMFDTQDIDASYNFMQAENIELASPIERFGDVAYFTFKDPDGNIQMVCQDRRRA